ELTVQVADPVEISVPLGQDLVILLLGKPPELGNTFWCDALRRPRRAVRFQQSAQLKHIVSIGARPLRNDRTMVRNEFEQPLCMQPTQRFPHRRSAHARSCCDFLLRDSRCSWIDAANDSLAHRLISLVHRFRHGVLPLSAMSLRQARQVRSLYVSTIRWTGRTFSQLCA